MAFRTLPPELTKLLTAGIEDELTPAREKHDGVITKTPCMRCGGAMQPHLHASMAFTDASPLPRTVGRCVDCGLILDPISGLVLDTGDASKIEEALPLVGTSESHHS